MAVNISPQVNVLTEWRAFLREFGATDFVWAEDSFDGQAARAYGIRSLGTTVIVDRDGRVAYRDDTTSTYAMLREGVLQALD